MINAPPDPAASLEAEQRSEDDGMPEHPLKAVDPAGWAEEHVEREKAAALGYPSSRVGQAWTDLMHTAVRLIDRVRPAKHATAVSAASAGCRNRRGIGDLLTVYSQRPAARLPVNIGPGDIGHVALSSVDVARYRRIRNVAILMDAALRIPGTRFRVGLASIIGLPPGVGDAFLTAISLWIVWQGRLLGLPRTKIAMMLGNVAIETALGGVPVIGDVMDGRLEGQSAQSCDYRCPSGVDCR